LGRQVRPVSKSTDSTLGCASFGDGIEVDLQIKAALYSFYYL